MATRVNGKIEKISIDGVEFDCKPDSKASTRFHAKKKRNEHTVEFAINGTDEFTAFLERVRQVFRRPWFYRLYWSTIRGIGKITQKVKR
jgi:hypothetical protein